MKAQELFGLAVRLVGVVFLYHGLREWPLAFGGSFDALKHLPGSFQDGTIISRPFLCAWPFVVALWFLFGAPPLMRIAYPRRQENPGGSDSGGKSVS